MSEHGTHAGYQRHRRAGEDACDACRKANTERSKAYIAANATVKARHRLLTKARQRALSELAKKHRYEFARLYQIELAHLEAQEEQ